MAITELDINLKKLLENFAPHSFPEVGKIELADADFLLIAAILKLNNLVQGK